MPEERFGPVLVLDVVNNSNEDVAVGYEFESDNTSGGGEGSVPGCEHVSAVFGAMAGTYRITIDGDVVAQGAIPAGMLEGSVTRRIVVAPDGAAQVVGGLRWADTIPDGFTRRIGDCP